MNRSWWVVGLIVLVAARWLWKKPPQPEPALTQQIRDWESEGGRIADVAKEGVVE